MGIIQKQGSQHAVILYIGVAVGAISTIFIYPLNTELYGFAQFLVAIAILLSALSNLGINALTVKFFPILKDKKKYGGSFFAWLNLYSLVVFTCFSALALIFKDPIIELLRSLGFEEVDLLQTNYLLILALTGLSSAILLARQQSMNYRRIVIPGIIGEFSYKIFLPFIVLLSTVYAISLKTYGHSYLIYQGLVLLLLWLYLSSLGGLNFKFGWKEVFAPFSTKELTSYALFNSLTKIGNVLIFKLDAFMITLMLGASSTGVYFIFLFMANVVQIPFRSLNLIGSPIISKAWAEKNFAELSAVYKKSSLILSIVGSGIFLLIWSLLPDIVEFSSKTEVLRDGLILFTILGLAKLTDAVTSVNEQILVYSPKYAYNIFIILFVGLTNLLLNYFFIREYGLTGVAVASFISIALYNLIKITFIYFQFGLHPFSRALFVIFILAVVAYIPLMYVKAWDSIWWRWSGIAMVLLMVYLLPILRLKISPDFNDLFKRVWNRLPFLPLMKD